MNCFASSIFEIVRGNFFTNARLALAKLNVRSSRSYGLESLDLAMTGFKFRYSSLFRISIFGLLISYSYLSAATGSRREADQAGAKPENKPVRTETAMLTTTRLSENRIGKEGNACPMPVHITYATPSPMN